MTKTSSNKISSNNQIQPSTDTKEFSSEIVKIGDAAKMLGVSIDTLRRWEKKGQIQPIKTPGGTRLYETKALSDFKALSQKLPTISREGKIDLTPKAPTSLADEVTPAGPATKELLQNGYLGSLAYSKSNKPQAEANNLYQQLSDISQQSNTEPETMTTVASSPESAESINQPQLAQFTQQTIWINNKKLITLTSLSILTGFILLVTGFITAGIFGSYYINPDKTKSFFANSYQDTTPTSSVALALSPFNSLAVETMRVFTPNKVKELELDEPNLGMKVEISTEDMNLLQKNLATSQVNNYALEIGAKTYINNDLIVNGPTSLSTASSKDFSISGQLDIRPNIEQINPIKLITITSNQGVEQASLDSVGGLSINTLTLNGETVTDLVGAGLSVVNGQLTNNLAETIIPIQSGGTGITSTPSNGQLLIGNGSGYTLANITAGDNVTITNGPGSIKISASGSSSSSTSGVSGLNSLTGDLTLAGGGINSVTTGSGTITITGTEADTLDSVTARGATTSSNITFTGNISQTGSTTFSTGTGTINLNGDTIIAANKALIVGSYAADPGSPSSGTIFYNSSSNKFKIVENGVVKILCNTTDAGCGAGGGSTALSSLTAAVASNSINNADYAQTWNWNLATNNQIGFTFGENSASTATGTPAILSAQTLASSTAIPLYIINAGNGTSFRVDDQAADTTPFVVAADGNVGIGSTQPTASLDVNGAGIFSSTLTANTNETINGLDINAGSISDVAGYSQTAGNFSYANAAGDFSIDSDAFDVSNAGVVSGVTGYTQSSGNFNLTATSGAISASGLGASSISVSSADLSLATVTSGNINATTGAAAGLLNLLTGNLKIGNGSPDVTLDGEDAYIEGTLEVDGNARFDGVITANGGFTCTDCIALGSETSGNYVTSANTGLGLTGGSAGSEGAALTIALDQSAALSGDHSLSADQEIFGQSGLIFEGATADTIEAYLAFADPTASDKTYTFSGNSGTVLTTGNASSNVVTTLTGTADQVLVNGTSGSATSGAITLTLPQSINTTSAVTFLTLDTGQGANELYDMNQNVQTSDSVTFANLTLGAGGALRTSTSNGNTALLQAYDVDGASYSTFGTLTAGNTPTFDLASGVTIGGSYIYRAGGTDVAVADGGTGVSTFGGTNTLLYTSSADTLASIAAGTNGQFLVGVTGGAPNFVTMSGDVVTDNTGATTIQANSVALTTDTTGNYVQSITNGTGITGGNGGSEGAALTIALDQSAALSGDHSLSADQEIFGQSGLIFEGATADTIEAYLAFADPTASDKTYTFSGATGTVLTTGNASSNVVTTLTGTADQVLVNGTSGSATSGAITLTLPQSINTTSAVTFATVDTGQGANELYDMDQNVLTSSAVTFTTLDTGQGANELYDMDQNVLTSSAVTFTTLDTGQGANELYDMDQNVLTTSSVTFANLTLGAGGALRTSTSNGNTALLQAYDVDGASYSTFGTLTAGNTPTFDLASGVTIGGSYIYRAGGTDVAVADGGTGVSTFGGTNTLLYTSSADTLASIAAGTNGQFLVGVTGGAPSFVTMSGDVVTDNTGATTIQANSVALTTDTTGNYVQSITNGNGITGGDAGSEGAALTLAINLFTPATNGASSTVNSPSGLEFVSSQLTLLQGCGDAEILSWDEGNDYWECTTVTGIGGVGDITAVGNQSSGSAFTGNNDGNSLTFEGATNDGFDVVLTADSTAATRTYTLPELGTNGTFAFLEGAQSFTGAKTFSDLLISDTNVQLTGSSLSLEFNNAADRTLSVTNAGAGNAKLAIDSLGTANGLVYAADASGTLAVTTGGTTGQCLVGNTGAAPSWGSCTGSSGVTATGTQNSNEIAYFTADDVIDGDSSFTFVPGSTNSTTFTLTNSSLTSGSLSSFTSTNNSAADTAWVANLLTVNNTQGTTAVSTGSIYGLNINFNQNTSIAGNTESAARIGIALNNSASTDQTVSSILSLENDDDATGNQITASRGLNIDGSNITDGLYLNGTFGSNLINTSTGNFLVSQTGAVTASTIDTGQGANELYDMDQNVLTSSSVTFANLTLGAGGALRTSTSNGNTALLQAYDVDGASYSTFGTLTAGNTPTFDLASGVTIGGSYIYRAGGTDVAVADGGTGVSTFGGTNTLLYTSSADTLASIAAGTNGQFLVGVTGGAPNFVTMSGDVVTDNTGATTIQANSVALTTDTTGNYVQSITNGTGITGGNGGSEGAALTLAVDEAYNFAWTGIHSYTNTLTATSSQSDFNLTLGDDADADTISAVNIDVTSVDTGADGDVIRALNITNLGGGNSNVTETAIYLGTGWDNLLSYNGTTLINGSGQIVGGQITDDSLDFAQFQDTLDIDATTDINLGASNLTIDMDSTGDFSIRDGSTDILAFTDSGAISATPTSGQNFSITTAGVGDIQLTTASNNLVNVLTGNLKIGNGSPTVSLDGEDAYIEGTLEVDGAVRLDTLGSATGNSVLCYNSSNQIASCTGGTLTPTLQNIYDNDANGSNTVITLSANDDSLVFQNPASSGTDSTFVLQLSNLETGNTDDEFKILDIASTGSFDTSASDLINYGGYFNNTSTESAGGNVLINVGLYAAASGGDENYAAIFEGGNVGIGSTAPTAALNVIGAAILTGTVTATTDETINGLDINAGSISDVAGYLQTTGTFSASGLSAATLSVSSGTLALETVTTGNITMTTAANSMVNLLTGNLSIGNGSPDVTLNGEDAYIEGTLEVDGNARFDGVITANGGFTCTDCIALGSETSGNYVTSANTGLGLTGGSAGSEGAALTIALDQSAALSGDHSLSADQEIFGQSGLIFEGATADTIEAYLAFADPTASDKTYTFSGNSGTVLTTGNASSNVVTTLTGTADQVLVNGTSGSATSGAITLTLPQSINTTSAVTFATVDTGQGANELYDMNQNVQTSDSVTFANLTLGAGGALRTSTSNGNTALLQAYDVDGASYTTFGTLTAGNTPTFDLASGVTIGGSYIYRAGGTDVAVADGGTGVSTFGGTNTLLYTSSADTLASISAGTNGQFLVGVTGGAPNFVTMSGDVVTDNTGATTIQANSVALTTDTTGNYVASANTGLGLTGGSAGSEGAALTIALDQSAALSGDHSLSADQEIFGQSGLIFEGATADTIEAYLAFADPTVSDKTYTFSGNSGTVLTTGNASSNVVTTLTGTADQVLVNGTSGSATSGAITLTLPQSINTTSAVTFLTLDTGQGANELYDMDQNVLTTSNVSFNNITANGNLTATSGIVSLTGADTSLINLAAVNVSGTSEGLILPQNNSACSASTAEGQICWDTGNDRLYVGTGSGVSLIGNGSGTAFSSSGGVITKTTTSDYLSLRYGDAGDTQLELENTTTNTIPTVDAAIINLTGNTTGIVTDGVDALSIAAEFGNGTANTNSAINIAVTPVNTPSGDENFYGLNVANLTASSATEYAINVGTGWDRVFSSANFYVTQAGAITSDTLDTGQGANELYDMDQNVLTSSAVTFTTLDTGQGANELYDMDQNVLTTSSVTFANLTLGAGGALRTSTSNGNTALLQAYDVDGASYTTFGTLTAGNTPTFDLASGVTIGGSYIYRAGGTDVAVADGGTGVSTFGGTNTLLYTSSADTLASIAAGTNGQFLVGVTGGAPNFVTMSGDVVTDNTGATTIQANSVALTTDTTGNYVQSITNGTGITGGNGGSEGAALTLAVDQSTNFAWTGIHSYTNTLTATSSQSDFNLTLGDDADADTISAVNIDVTSAATSDADNVYGINIGNLSSADATVNERALRIGSGWDTAIDLNGTYLSSTELGLLDGRSGTLLDTANVASYATTGVTAGNGLTGGGTIGVLTVDVATGLGLTITSDAVALDTSAALSGDHTLGSNEAKFGQSGLIFEGSSADTIEAYLAFADPTASDKTYTFSGASGTVWTSGNDGSSSTLDADSLDGIDSGSFLRSDTSDSFTSGTLSIATGTTFQVDSGSTLDINSTAVSIADTNISLDGASTTFSATGALTLSSALASGNTTTEGVAARVTSDYGDNDEIFQVGDSARNFLTILGNGKIGINSTTADYASTYGSGPAVVSLKGTASGQTSALQLANAGSSANGQFNGAIDFLDNNTITSRFYSERTNGANSGTIKFETRTSAGVLGTRMTIYEDGNVGIGDDTTPDVTFEVEDNVSEQFRLGYDNTNYTAFSISSGGDLTLNASGNQVILADGDTLNIGGVSTLAYNAISDSGTTSHSLASDDDLYIEGDLEVDGSVWFDGTLTVSDITCTDCLDFTELADSMSLDATTDINLGANALTIDLDSSGDFSIRDVTTDIATFADSGAITFAPTSGQDFSLTTAGVGDVLLTSGDTMLLDSAGVLELNSSAGAISIGNDNVNQAINIGTAGTRTVTIGSANATLALTSGSSDITLTSADDIILAPSDDITSAFAAGSQLVIDAATTDSTTTGGVFDLNVDTVTNNNIGFNLDYFLRDSGGITGTGARINATIDTDAGHSSTGYGLYINGANDDASSTLTALYVDAGTGAGTEYAAAFMNGNVGIGSTNPGATLDINGTLRANNNFYINGGISNLTSSSDILNLNKSLGPDYTSSWSTGATGGTARNGQSSVLYNGKIYSWGGYTSGTTNTMDIYDIASNTWSTGASGGTARAYHISVVYNGKIYMWGGETSGGVVTNILDIYDIATDSWSTGATGGTARRYASAVLYNGKIYSWGGANSGLTGLNTVDIYDIAGDSWTTGTSGGTARVFQKSILYNGKMYSWGGYNGSSYTNTLDIYDIDAGSWTTGTTGGTSRGEHSSILYNGKIYSWGGSAGGSALTTVDIYDIPTSTWTTGVSSAAGRRAHSSVFYNGKIYSWAGQISGSNSNTLDIYDIGYKQTMFALQENGQDVLAFRTNSEVFLSNGRLGITGGNVGIGDTTADSKIEILSTTEQLRLTHTDGTKDARFTVDTNGLLTIDTSTDGTVGSVYFTDDVLVGASSETLANAGFVVDGNDLFVSGMAGIEGNIYADGVVTLAGSADGTDALVLTTGDILVSDGDLDLSGGDFNVALDAGDSALISKGAASSSTAVLGISNTTAAADTNGSLGQTIGLTVTNYADDGAADTHVGLDVLVTQNASDAGTNDITYGIRLQNLAGSAQSNSEYGFYQAGTGWDYGIYAEDAVWLNTTLTLVGNMDARGDIADSTGNLTLNDDVDISGTTGLTFTGVGADIIFTNGETINNDTNGTIALTTNTAGTDTIFSARYANDDGVDFGTINLLGKSNGTDPSTCSAGDIYFNDSDNVFKGCYDANTWVSFAPGASTTFDDVYANSVTATDLTMEIDDTTGLTFNMNTTGAFAIQDNGTTFWTFDDDSTVDVLFPAAGSLTIDAATTDSTLTTGVFDLNVDTVTNNNIGFNLDYILRDSAGITGTGARINATIDTDAAHSSTGYGLYIAGANDDTSSTLTALYVDAGTGVGSEYAAAFMNGNVGIGTATPGDRLTVSLTNSTLDSSINAQQITLTDSTTITSASNPTKNGLKITASSSGDFTDPVGDTTFLQGLSSSATYSGTVNSAGAGNSLSIRGGNFSGSFSGAVSNAADGVNIAGISLSASGNIGTTGSNYHYGAFASASGTADANYGIYLTSVANATNNYGLYINTVASAAGNWALYSNAAAQSYFAGNVGLGDTTADAQLEILSTSEQLRLTHTDGTKDARFTVDTNGLLTIDTSTDGTAGSVYTTDDVLVGASTETLANAGFVVNGDDLFVAGSAGVEGSIYTDTSLIVGSTTTIADGSITQSTTGAGTLTIATSGGSAGRLILNSAAPSGQTTTEAISVKTTTDLAATDEVFQIGDSAADFMTVLGNGNIGVGDVSPDAKFDIDSSSTSATDFGITNTGVMTGNVFSLVADSLTTGKGFDVSLDGLTSGIGFNLSSTSTAYTSGRLMSLDWTPGSSTTGSGDLFRLSIGANGTTSGNLFNIVDGSSSVFSVSETAFTTSLPAAFNAAGDVSIAYDLNFSNPTSSYINSAAPLYIRSGETFNSSDLTFNTYNFGSIVFDSVVTSGSGTKYTTLINAGDSTTNANTNYGIHLTNTLTGAAAKTGYGMYSTLTSSSTTADTLYGIYSAVTQSGATTSGTKNTYGIYSAPATTGVNTSSATINLYGQYSAPSSTTSTTATVNVYGQYVSNTATVTSTGTINNYGVYIANGTSDTTGTSTKYGLYVAAQSGADNNYMIYMGGAPTTANTTALCWDNSGDSPITDCNGSATDLAENYGTSDASVEAGDLVVMTGEAVAVLDPHEGKYTTKSYVSKSTGQYQANIIGVISTNPNQVFGEDGIFSPGENPRPVSLAGRVPVKVSSENGSIQVGDYITSSSIPGVAMKATQAGVTVGRALQAYNGNGVGSVIMYIHVGYADPSNVLANLTIDQDGFLLVPKLKVNNIDINEQLVNLTTFNTQLANMTGEISEVSNLLADIQLEQDNLVDQVLGLETQQQELSDQVIEISQSTASNSAMLANVMDQQASDSALIASNSAEIASKSADIADLRTRLEQLELTPPDVLLATGSAQFANLVVTEQASTLKLETLEATIAGTLRSFGDTYLANTTIAGDLTQDGTLSITNGSTINSLGTLYLQSNSLAEVVDIFNGAITMTQEGVVTLQKLIVPATALAGSSEDPTIGSATITNGQSSIIIYNNQISDSAKVFVTPRSATNGNALIVDQVSDGVSFRVNLQSTATSNVDFDWWIIETQP